MKTVDVVTYCEWKSYGSVLQAWALKYFLTVAGCDVKHIRLNSISSDAIKLYFKVNGIKSFLINVDRFLNRKNLRRRFELTTQFFSENFNFIKYSDYEELKTSPPVADVYIAGSDQIWNPNSMTPFFYLDFVSDTTKKMSYAASMGVSAVPECRKNEWYNSVESFQYVSVREKEVKKIIQSKIDKDVEVHIDPTFLVDKNGWRTIEKSYSIKKPYILVYALYWDKSFNKQLKELHKTTGLPVVAISSQLQQVYSQKKLYDVSVQEFLWLFDNASYIITSSFHGAAFSIIFEKKFSVVTNPKKPSRLNAILDTFEIENVAIENLHINNGPDYKRVRKIILNEREKSNEYLRRGINLQ